MKRISKLFFCIAVCLTGLELTGCDKIVSLKKRSRWNFIKQVSLTQNMASRSAGWYNEKFAVSVGCKGKMYVIDGENSDWKESENNAEPVCCIDITNEGTVWTFGKEGKVQVTRNLGETWESVPSCLPFENQTCIDFADCFVGLVSSDCNIALTQDGGETWQNFKCNDLKDRILCVSCLADGSGYALTKNFELHFTEDKGENWKTKKIDALKDIAKDGELAACDFNFEDEMNGKMVASIFNKDGTNAIFYLSTNNGGEIWNTELVEKKIEGTVTNVLMSKAKNYISFVDMKGNVKLYRR